MPICSRNFETVLMIESFVIKKMMVSLCTISKCHLPPMCTLHNVVLRTFFRYSGKEELPWNSATSPNEVRIYTVLQTMSLTAFSRAGSSGSVTSFHLSPPLWILSPIVFGFTFSVLTTLFFFHVFVSLPKLPALETVSCHMPPSSSARTVSFSSTCVCC